MHTALKTLLLVVCTLIGIFFIEQIFYRFHQNYAQYRAEFLWKLSDKKSFPKWLKNIPIDQFQTIPGNDSGNGDKRLKAETKFTRAVLGHTRAARDKIYNEFLHDAPPAAKPSLKPVKFVDYKGIDRTILEPSGENGKIEGTVLWIIKKYKKEKDAKAVKKKLEKQFTPLFRKSIACGIVDGDISAVVNALVDKHPHLARRISVWVTSDVSEDFALQDTEKFDLLVFHQPKKLPLLSMDSENPPFILVFTDENTDETVQDKALDWLDDLRKLDRKPSEDRLRALLYHGKSSAYNSAEARLALGYSYVMEVNRVLGPPEKLDKESEEHAFKDDAAPKDEDALVSVTEPPDNGVDLPLLDEIDTYDEPFPDRRPADFDCETLRIWRNRFPELQDYSNRRLTLDLGQHFEEKGLLSEVRTKDPNFVVNYESLKLIHAHNF